MGIKLAIIGGGPSSLYLLQALAVRGSKSTEISVFESSDELGAGFPYSSRGAGDEHVTNISANEIPALPQTLADWLAGIPDDELGRYGLSRHEFTGLKVLPRLLFGRYLQDQFARVTARCKHDGLRVTVRRRERVVDIRPAGEKFELALDDGTQETHHYVVLATGHAFPQRREGREPGAFDSPYPPAKLTSIRNENVAIRGSSLTAIDAIRTLSRNNGRFVEAGRHKREFLPARGCEQFSIVMRSRHGIIPCVRIHFQDPELTRSTRVSEEQLADHIKENGGYLSLDYLYEEEFLRPLKERDPEFYEEVRTLTMEQFVERMLGMREQADPFALLEAEYQEAQRSIDAERPVHWKEMLASLSYAVNYPAKHLSAEDMLRLRRTLQPLISTVIAFLPQGSCEELLALHRAGRISLEQSEAVDGAPFFIDCSGQPHLSFEQFPFEGLRRAKAVAPARLRFRSASEGEALLAQEVDGVRRGAPGEYTLDLPGVAVGDSFEALSPAGVPSRNLFIMAPALMSGHNPDYSGLDFCATAAQKIVAKLHSEERLRQNSIE